MPLLRAADLALARAAFLVLLRWLAVPRSESESSAGEQRWVAAARSDVDSGELLAAADGLGALVELAMRCDAANLPLVDSILDLVALVCRGTSENKRKKRVLLFNHQKKI